MTVTAHRIVRTRLRRIDNVGVVLSRLAPPQARSGQRGRQDEQLAFLRDKLAKVKAADRWYVQAFERWKAATRPGPHRRVLRFRADSPLVVGMGESSPLENGLSLHGTYGTPIVPGSSMKGVCRAFCARCFSAGDPWGEGGEAFGHLFGRGGDTGEPGAVDFLDAMLEPYSGGFMLEVLTPHHGSYYRGKQKPLGWDGPIPVHFLAVEGSFRVVLEGPPAWLEPACQILKTALAEHGIGAKTRAGHGRLSFVGEEGAPHPPSGTGASASRRVGHTGGPLDAILAANKNTQQVQAELRAWLLGKRVGIADIAALDRKDAANCRAVAEWMRAQGMERTWRKQIKNKKTRNKAEAARTCLEFLNRWSGGD